jgi:hypothetical protein
MVTAFLIVSNMFLHLKHLTKTLSKNYEATRKILWNLDLIGFFCIVEQADPTCFVCEVRTFVAP